VAPRVRFLGLLTGRERLAALRAADVVACASEHESFGLVPLEALMVGTPAVAADDSGAADIIRGTRGALLVRPGDVTALARAIRTILDDVGAWRAAAAQAAAVVRDRCSPGRIAQAAVQLYDEVLATRADGVLA
jgi:glycosyltransferase involved in cell wall biosynthesis